MKKCSICGKKLSSYNSTNICFCHRFDEFCKEEELDPVTESRRVVWSLCVGGSTDGPFNHAQMLYNGRRV